MQIGYIIVAYTTKCQEMISLARMTRTCEKNPIEATIVLSQGISRDIRIYKGLIVQSDDLKCTFIFAFSYIKVLY